MKRIMVIGCCGAGKSTLSRQLQQKLDLPLIHLDQHYWKAGWVESAADDWKNTVESLASREQWIIDGNYGGTLDIRLNRADTVILVKASTLVCLFRVIKRVLKNYGKVRPDMPAGCPERFSWEFLVYVTHFNATRLPAILKKLDQVKEKKNVIFLDSRQKVAAFIKKIPNA